MSEYAIWFDYGNKTYRLPVNPGEIKETTTQANEKYEILGLGQIVIPTYMELREFSFETEFPRLEATYVGDGVEFYDADDFLDLFKKVRTKKKPIRFTAVYITASLSASELKNLDKYASDKGNSTSSMVLIEELSITEKAGEEGDKYVEFKLIEYRDFGKAAGTEIDSATGKKKKKESTVLLSAKSNGYYVVKSGDSLWKIAKALYCNGAKANIIYNANKSIIKTPGLLRVGWKLKIPTTDEFSKYSAALPKVATNVTIKKKSTTFESASGQAIAAKYIQEYDGGTPISHSTGGVQY